MLTHSGHDRNAERGDKKRAPTGPAPASPEAGAHNPLWQSLAFGSGVLQRKLAVGAPGDVYEQEADRVAQLVTSAPAPVVQRACGCGGGCGATCSGAKEDELRVQTKRADAGGAVEAEAPPSVEEALRSPGEPLDEVTRGFMEERLGHDFGGVRLHSGAKAAESARAVNSLAYTVGPDIVLGAAAPPPPTAPGPPPHTPPPHKFRNPQWDASLARLKLVKVCNDAGDAVPEGCGRVLPDGGEGLTALAQWEMLLTEPLLVVGGTPGGLYRLVKQGAAKGRAVDWSGEHFDLVVVDEASQMGLAEALTAAAFLRADGQFIAVGDHRQMPPILAHAWDAEARRDLKRSRVFLSVFEYLQELGFPRVALDRSFRIPEEVADFLRRHVYAADGIDFRSANRTRLAECEGLDEEWLCAALAPEHALVVVEHDEEGSQQSNEFEAALVESIARAATEGLQLDARTGIGVVVPHRAQKALLAARLPHLADSIDTVERFQGGERELIVVSATVSDREFAESESDFLLEPRRLTVAVSRPRRKLVVVASRAVFDLIPQDLDAYERGSLWKRLRRESARTLFDGEVSGHRVTVRAL